MRIQQIQGIAIAGLAMAMGVIATGCKRDEVSVYTTPKAPVAVEQPHLHWDLPAGWQEKPAGGMRAGSFAVRNAEGEADISIIPLPGESGSELDNVNRWRGQVGLDPIPAEQLASISEPVTIGDTDTTMVDLAGTDPTSQKPARILAATIKTEGTTWFIKMIGPDALVAEQKPAFKQFLKSLSIHGAGAHAPQTAAAPSATPMSQPTQATTSAAPAPPAVPTAGPASNGLPEWEVPQGWDQQAATTMLLAKFGISGPQSAKAEVTVSAFPGDTGGLFANVNRWRRQIGLGPVDESELTKLTSEIDVNGAKAVLVDVSNPSAPGGAAANRIVAVILPRGGQSWFFKMSGDSVLIEQQKSAFIKFVQSVRFPNA